MLFSSISELCESNSRTTIVFPPDPFPPKRKGRSSVNITNNLGPNIDLTLRCKSKDDDLGTHILPSNASFGFNSNRNIWGTTLFFCGFRRGDIEFHWFNI